MAQTFSKKQIVKKARVTLMRILLPASDNGLFTPSDILPKQGVNHGSHIVCRDVTVTAVTDKTVTGVIIRKGITYKIVRDADADAAVPWRATARLDNKGKIAVKA